MDAARQLKYHTIDDIYNLPDGQRAELINGELYLMSAPGQIHQEIVHFFDRTIGNYILDRRGDCKIYPAPFAVFLNEQNDIYVEPDISVICDKNKLTEDGCKGAPDWIIEVASPSSRSMDYNKKLFMYHTAGVREYWIVDYEKDQVMAYNFEQDEMAVHTFSDRIRVGIYDELEIHLSEIDLK